jgi:multiple sugar transport system substrate-binding protein
MPMARIYRKGIPFTLLLTVIGVLLFVFIRDENSSPPTASIPNGSQEPVTITFYPYYMDELGRWDLVVREFERRYPHIRVQVVPVYEKSNNPDEAMKQLDFLAATGREMDVVLLSSAQQYAKRAAIGMLEPLNRYIAGENLDVTREYKIDPSIDGTYYALPGRYYEWLTVLNAAHLEEAGLSVPTDWTWDDYLEYARRLTISKGVYRRYGTFFQMDDFYSFWLFGGPDPYLLKSDGSSNLLNPAVAESLRTRYRAEVEDRSATPYAYTLSQKIEARPHYFNQAVSMLITRSWFALETGGTALYPATFKTVFAPLPKAANGGQAGSTTAGADFLGISAKSRHKPEAYHFIRWYSTEGIAIQSSFLSSWRMPDMKMSVRSITESARHPELIDTASLIRVLDRSKPVFPFIPKPYLYDVEGVFSEEAGLYLLQHQDLQATLMNGERKAENIIRVNAQ